MRIVHLVSSPVWSGPMESVALLALAQRALGHDVSVAVDQKRLDTTSEEGALSRIRELALENTSGLELSVKSAPHRIWMDLLKLRGLHVDVVHAHRSHDAFLARWGRPAGARLVRSLHTPRSLGLGLPAADAYTVFSAEAGRRLGKRPWVVLPPLVGPEFEPPEDRTGLRAELGLEGDPIVGMASTFQRSRRHMLALEAFLRLRETRPAARLVLLGDGGEMEGIRSTVRTLELAPSVTFAGYQAKGAFGRWLGALDVLWILGLGNDWSGRTAAQGRSCGVRVVAASLGGLTQLADCALPDVHPKAIVEATLSGARATVRLQTNDEIARRVVQLYEGGT